MVDASLALAIAMADGTARVAPRALRVQGCDSCLLITFPSGVCERCVEGVDACVLRNTSTTPSNRCFSSSVFRFSCRRSSVSLCRNSCSSCSCCRSSSTICSVSSSLRRSSTASAIATATSSATFISATSFVALEFCSSASRTSASSRSTGIVGGSAAAASLA